MTPSLSKSSITSFPGAVLPLHVGFDGEEHARLSRAEIKWECDSDILTLRRFSGDDAKSFNNGVLLILNKPGEATVTATLDGVRCTCSVTVKEREGVSPDGELQYFVGDLHDHSGNYHDREKFAERTSGFQNVMIDCVKEDGLLDFCVISDHAVVENDTDFFRGFTEAERAEPMRAVVFPGTESEVVVTETDRFGIQRRKSGEIVTFNAAGYSYANSWEEFTDAFRDSPEPVGIFAHPQAVGFSTKGIWDFAYHKNNTPDLRRIIRGIEMGDGSLRSDNLIHELVYSAALDSGFRVSTTCSSDSHGSKWGYGRFPGKTVIMARERSREAFIDALRSNRFYATESGNLKLKYTVNGRTAPCDLDLSSEYRFHVNISYFKYEETSRPVSCRVISDGGRTVAEINSIRDSELEFTVHSDTARYFYLRFIDREGRRTWSCPVFCGREYDKYEPVSHPLIDLSCATATDTVTGADAQRVINGNPDDPWLSVARRASIIIDLKSEHTLNTLEYTPRTVTHDLPSLSDSWHSTDYTAGMPAEFEIYTSLDGESFEKRAEGVYRVLGGETLTDLGGVKARYVRVDVLSTVGAYAKPTHYRFATVSIGNLALFGE